MAWHYHVQTSKTWYRPNTSKENYFETSKYCCFMPTSIEQSFTSCSDYTFPFQSHRLLILVILKIFFLKVALSVTQHKMKTTVPPAVQNVFAHSQNSCVQFWVSFFIWTIIPRKWTNTLQRNNEMVNLTHRFVTFVSKPRKGGPTNAKRVSAYFSHL